MEEGVNRGAMESLFAKGLADLQRLVKLSEADLALLREVDEAADELLLPEFEHYVERRYNEQIPAILRNHNLLGLPLAARYGGRGADALVYALAMERLGQLGMGVVTFVDVQCSLGGLTLQQWGTEEQKQRYLLPAARGEKLLAYALTEPEAGSDPMALQSGFEEQREGYVLNGTKYLISNGSVADVLIVFAYPHGQRDGLCAFLVERGTPGFTVEMKFTEKVGLFTSDTALLEFRDCQVPPENLLGPKGKGAHVAYSALANGRIGIAAGCIGVIEDCLNVATERARQRVQHGKPLAKHQMVQRHIAQIAMDWEAARWPTYLAALKKRELDASPQDHELRAQVDLQSALAKRIASERAWDAADRAVQIFGGFGYSILSNAGRHYCDTRVARIYEGTDEIMELKIAASILGPEFEAYR